jgi:hypothetical protein
MKVDHLLVAVARHQPFADDDAQVAADRAFESSIVSPWQTGQRMRG